MPFSRNHVCAEVWISYEACQVGLDRWLSGQPASPAPKEWVEIRGYNNAARTRETAEMWNVSWVFAPVTIQKHNVVAALQPGKDAQSSPTENSDLPRQISLLERLLCKSCMRRILFNRIHMTIWPGRRSHHRSRVPMAAANL